MKVLYVDDDESDYLLLRRMLEKVEMSTVEVIIHWVPDFDEALRIPDVDVYLIDYYLGERDGLELLEALRRAGCTRPAIMLTGRGDRNMDLAAMRAGASEFLVKGSFDGTTLERTIRYVATLYESEERARRLQRVEALGKLAGGVAHEFNNILTVINGNTELLLNHPHSDPSVCSALNDIRRAGELGVSLTQQLLAFSRKQTVKPCHLDLGEVVDELQRMLGRLINPSVELRVHRRGPTPVTADAGHVEQIVLNLVLNACDAMGEGGVLTIETCERMVSQEAALSEQVPPGRYATLTVTDTGHGMPEEVRTRIFEPFFTTRADHGGTGLGLSTVGTLVRTANGHISLKTAPGDGTRFCVYLPLCTAPEARTALEREATALPGGNETILLVEDDAAVRRLTGSLLRSLGYTVLAAGESVEALRFCREHDGPIHLVVADCVTPGVSGPNLVAMIRSLRSEVRVIYMSGYPDDIVLQGRIAGEPLSFIQKPFRHRDLAFQVRAALSEPSGVRP